MTEDRSNAEIIADLIGYTDPDDPSDYLTALHREAANRLTEQALDLIYKDEVVEMLQLKVGMLEDPAGGRT